jgi:TRAP-type C4-dicarboxylate transport system substrate-binding protein
VLDVWQRSLAARGGGKLDIAIRWPGMGGRGDERSLVSHLKTGQIDGAVLPARALPSIAAAAAVVSLPGIVDSWSKVDWLRGHLRDSLQESFGKEGYRSLFWHDEGCQRLMSRGHPVRRVADLAHRRVAVLDGDAPSSALALVPGSIPVSLGEPDVRAALRDDPRLGVSVVLASAGTAERLGWARSFDSMTMMSVACTSGALVVRDAAFARLSAEARSLLEDVSGRAEDAAASRARQDDLAASLRVLGNLSKVEPSDAERREWQRFFRRAASQAAAGALQSLVEQAIDLGSEIDTLE